MEAINLKSTADEIPNLYEYKAIARMNNHVFTLVRVKERALDFHVHPESDEVFYVVEGEMKLEFRSKIVDLRTGDLCVVPRGVEHRPVCESEVSVMLIEMEGTLRPENTGGTHKG
jgi:mannose-6-phosphate isomerase-like protein (cupin superfamily)